MNEGRMKAREEAAIAKAAGFEWANVREAERETLRERERERFHKYEHVISRVLDGIILRLQANQANQKKKLSHTRDGRLFVSAPAGGRVVGRGRAGRRLPPPAVRPLGMDDGGARRLHGGQAAVARTGGALRPGELDKLRFFFEVSTVPRCFFGSLDGLDSLL